MLLLCCKVEAHLLICIMKAIILNENGGLDKLLYKTDVPEPQLKPNEVLVNVKATTVNRADLVIRNGYPGLTLKFPHILCGDIAGVVAKAGNDARNFKEGDRVLCWPIVVEANDERVQQGRAAISPT